MHHLILVRELDEQMSGSRCCGIPGDAARWDASGAIFAERRERMSRIGEIYRAVKAAFGEQVQITIVDPRNQISLLPLLLRDGMRYHIPFRAVLEAFVASGVSTGIFDGQLVFSRQIPAPEDVVGRIAARLEVHRVGR